MFLCDQCHNLKKHLYDGHRSYGRCEGCGKDGRACIDCHERACLPPRAKKGKGRQDDTRGNL